MPPEKLRRRSIPLTERIAGWSMRHRVWAIVGWFAILAIALASQALIPGDGPRAVDPGDSGRAAQALESQNGFVPPLENVLIQAPDATGDFASDPALTKATRDLVDGLQDLPGAVLQLRSPLDADGEAQISHDGHSGLVSFYIAGPDTRFSDHYDAVVAAVKDAADANPQVRLFQAGETSLSKAVDESIKDDFSTAETTSLPLTLLILLVVFGALTAASIPLLLAATTVVTTFGFLQVVDHWLPINSATSSMVLLIGMAVGIDYSLFYLRRQREERAAGASVDEALRTSARTSGRVVVVSGLTVMVCVSGLLFTGLDNFTGLTVGAAMVVGVAVIGSVTVLPALLAALGRRVDSGRIPLLGKSRTAARRSRTWESVARAVVHKPLLWGGAATVALLVLALPMLNMHLQDAAQVDSLPRSIPTVDAALRMQDAFPGSPSRAQAVVWRPDGGEIDKSVIDTGLDTLHAQVADSGGLLFEPISVIAMGDAWVVRVPLAGSGTEPKTNEALELLRDSALPAAFGDVDGVDTAVGGKTAFAYDFAAQLGERTWPVFGFVLILAFGLLLASFRSAAISLVSILLNLLSMAAAYGVLTWVFQDGHFEGLLGFTSYGGVVGWLPLFMFVILFGLSMDYHIFILSRIRERFGASGLARDSIVSGIGASAGVVTSAAVIMVAAFTVFVTLTAIEYKMLGIGMAVAILIDATVVRGVLLPAALALLGDHAWPKKDYRVEV